MKTILGSHGAKFLGSVLEPTVAGNKINATVRTPAP
jgi:hypothetical protein